MVDYCYVLDLDKKLYTLVNSKYYEFIIKNDNFKVVFKDCLVGFSYYNKNEKCFRDYSLLVDGASIDRDTPYSSVAYNMNESMIKSLKRKGYKNINVEVVENKYKLSDSILSDIR